MNKVIIDKQRMEDLLCKLSTIPSIALAFLDEVENIELTEEQRKIPSKWSPKSVAIDLGYVLRNYSQHIYKQLSEFFEEAEDYKG